MTTTLVFAYNADSGLFNALADIAHKALSPRTYACNLCALTHSPFGMRREWRQFLAELPVEKEFLHADELRRQGAVDVSLPAVFERHGGELKPWLGADEINACRTMEDLMGLIRAKLGPA